MIKYTTYDPAVDSEIKYIAKTLKANKITFLIILNKWALDDDGNYQGSFDDEGRVLDIAVGRPISRWFPILMHEFSHFCQWMENAPIWQYASKADSYTIMWDYLNGLTAKSKHVKTHINIVKQMELDCERRALVRMERFTHIMSQAKCAQHASAYIYFHDFMYKRGKWYNKKKGKRPMTHKDILKLMPSDLDGDYNKPPKGLYELFEGCI